VPIIQTLKELKPRDTFDHYPTPLPHVRAGLDLLPAIHPARILDPGAGGGIWGTEARSRWPESNITGVELRTINPALQFPYDCWYTADFLTCPIPQPFDLVIGNPPYRHAEEFVRRDR
jgi:methylase of polypeptide subunit release factors